MRFYTGQHQYYCGIDLHARTMYLCILNQAGEVLLHRDLPAGPEPFLRAIEPYRASLAVAVECIFTWYWLADLCAREQIAFVLGHALYMKAIHGLPGQERQDRRPEDRGAAARRDVAPGLCLPRANARHARSLRRRNDLMRQRAELLAHITSTNHQYNHPPGRAAATR